MKTLLEKLHINKNTKHYIYDCCMKLGKLLDELWNDYDNIPDPEEREDYFIELIDGDKTTYVDDLLDRLCWDNLISKEEVKEYHNNDVIIAFCSELADRLKNNKPINIEEIYKNSIK